MARQRRQKVGASIFCAVPYRHGGFDTLTCRGHQQSARYLPCFIFPLYKKTIMQTQRNDEPWDFPASTPTRPDWHTARFVKQGIRMQSIHGTGYAANFLRNRSVDIDVALRVLLQPARRRNYDQ
jgi:hypothetical protein